MKQIEPAKNQHDANARVGTLPSSRVEAATHAGMSTHQAKQAVRVASVPQDVFDTVIDDDAQERGEVGQQTGRPKVVTNENDFIPSAADIGLSRKDIHEARQLRDAAENFMPKRRFLRSRNLL